MTPKPSLPRRPAEGRRRAAAALAAAALLLAPRCRGGAPPPAAEAPAAEAMPWRPPAGMRVVLAEPAPANDVHIAAGRVELDEERTHHLGAPVDGRVLRVHARLGERVRRGQSLLTLRSPQVAALHAEVAKARQDVALADREVERLLSMHGDGAVSDRELLAARSEQAKARADLQHTTAALGNLGLGAARAGLEVELVARVAGTVIDRQVLVGQEVRADSEARLMTISDLSVVWVIAEVFEADVAAVAEGYQVAVRVPAYPNVAFPGEVAHVGDVVDPASHTVRVRCALPNPDGRLKPQMSAQIEVHSPPAASRGSWLPASAVLLEGAEAHIWVVGAAGPERRAVTLGRARGGRQLVLSGLAVGESVVAEGALFLDRAESR